MAKNARHTPTLEDSEIERAISVDIALLPHVGDALTMLTHEWAWIEVGDSVADIVEAMKAIVEEWYS